MAIEEIEIEGYVGQNPKYPNSSAYPNMLTFSVGVTQKYKAKDSNNWESKTTWYDIISGEKDKSSYLSTKLLKGDKVVIKGKPTLKTWIDKEGKTNAVISIILRNIVLMKKSEEYDRSMDYNNNKEKLSSNNHQQQNDDFLNDDLPF